MVVGHSGVQHTSLLQIWPDHFTVAAWRKKISHYEMLERRAGTASRTINILKVGI